MTVRHCSQALTSLLLQLLDALRVAYDLAVLPTRSSRIASSTSLGLLLFAGLITLSGSLELDIRLRSLHGIRQVLEKLVLAVSVSHIDKNLGFFYKNFHCILGVQKSNFFLQLTFF